MPIRADAIKMSLKLFRKDRGMKASFKFGIGVLAVLLGLAQMNPALSQGKGGTTGDKGGSSGKGDLIPTTPGDIDPLPTRDPEPNGGVTPSPPRKPLPTETPTKPKPSTNPSTGDKPDETSGSGGSQVGGQTDTKPGSGGKSVGKNEKTTAGGN